MPSILGPAPVLVVFGSNSHSSRQVQELPCGIRGRGQRRPPGTSTDPQVFVVDGVAVFGSDFDVAVEWVWVRVGGLEGGGDFLGPAINKSVSHPYSVR